MWTGFSFMCSWEESADAASLVRFHSSFVLFTSILCDRTRFAKTTGCSFFPILPLTAPLYISSHPSLHLLPWPRPGCHSVRLRVCFQGYCADYRCRLVALVSLGSLNFFSKRKRKQSLSFWSFYDFPVAPVSSTVSWTWCTGYTGVRGAFRQLLVANFASFFFFN